MGRDAVAQDRARPTRASAGMSFDVAQIDEVLATTRAVRRRLDLERPVDNQLLLDCIDLAEQAPTGGNLGSRRWIIVREQRVKDQLGELYRETALPFMSAAAERLHGTGHPEREGDGIGRRTSPNTSPRSPPSSSRPSSAATTAAGGPACSTRSSRRRGASASPCVPEGWAPPG